MICNVLGLCQIHNWRLRVDNRPKTGLNFSIHYNCWIQTRGVYCWVLGKKGITMVSNGDNKARNNVFWAKCLKHLRLPFKGTSCQFQKRN